MDSVYSADEDDAARAMMTVNWPDLVEFALATAANVANAATTSITTSIPWSIILTRITEMFAIMAADDADQSLIAIRWPRDFFHVIQEGLRMGQWPSPFESSSSSDEEVNVTVVDRERNVARY